MQTGSLYFVTILWLKQSQHIRIYSKRSSTLALKHSSRYGRRAVSARQWLAQCGRIPYQQRVLPPGVLHTFECDDVTSRDSGSAECYLHREDTRGLFRPLPPPLQIHRSNPSASANRFSVEGKGFLRSKTTYMQATFAPCENPMMPSNGLWSIAGNRMGVTDVSCTACFNSVRREGKRLCTVVVVWWVGA